MKRVLCLIVVFIVVSLGAASAHAQSGRARRAEPAKDERAGEKFEQKDEAKDAAEDAAKNTMQDSAPETAGRENVLTAKEVSVRADINAKPLPMYPSGARQYGVEGRVKLRIILGADGKIRDEIEVLEGLPHGVTEEAIKAARRIKFEPAQKDGRPVSQYVTLVYNFNLY
jgi:TonB family protein